jgi:hypothetical protein
MLNVLAGLEALAGAEVPRLPAKASSPACRAGRHLAFLNLEGLGKLLGVNPN